jgi:hypothetical protein
MDAAALADRYGVGAASLRARFKFLGIDPETVTPPDIAKLDALAQHLAAGATIESFSYTPVTEVQLVAPGKKLINHAITPFEPPPELGLDLEHLERIYAFLQRASDNEWHLPTGVIRQLTGATPKGSVWKRFGFEFIPATRHGAERAWAIQKASWDFPLI